MRGKATKFFAKLTAFGITPACAGKRDRSLRETRRSQDHPRVCGEKLPSGGMYVSQSGSPPRVRGKVSLCLGGRVVPRITPACAGKRSLTAITVSSIGDHPRVCGEKFRKMSLDDRIKGSPPRVRGKGGPCSQRLCDAGITPACAGKRLRPSRRSQPHQDHPRVCGEKAGGTRMGCTVPGSPPRVRGKVLRAGTGCRRDGITPACAGKSPWSVSASRFARDHPRVCGEKTKKIP